MTTPATRTWAARASALAAGSALLLAACSSPQGSGSDEADVPVVVTSSSAPATVDPAALGWESADAALGLSPALAESVGECGPEIVAAARQVVGVVCSTDAGSRALYADAASGEVWASADLLAEDGRQRLGEALVQAGAATASGTSDDPADPALLEDVRFDSGGNLVVVTGGAAWQVGSAEAASLLSEKGRLVRGAVRSGGPFVVPGGEPPAGAAVVVAASAQLPPPPAKPRPSGGGVDCSVEKCIAITFDDGPGPHTEKLLDVLKARDAKATFFMLGSLVGGRPDTVKRMVDEGHEVANHTWNHPDLRTIGADGVTSQLSRTQDAIEAASGVEPQLMRPPYGATNGTAVDAIAAQGLSIIMWDVDTEDWKNRSASETTSRALASAHEGAIILFHDIHPSTVDAAPGIIDALHSQGYTLVTVSNLLGDPEPGVKYYSSSNP